MDNLAIVNEVVEQEGFMVNTDELAEWACQKISEEKAELERIESVCNSMIYAYKMQIERAKKNYENKTSYLIGQLEQYFKTVTPKLSKTQATYKLPSGTLKRKFGGLDYIRDEEKLLTWVKDNGGAEEFIQVKESVKWAELKKTITVSGINAVDSDGEIIPGITVNQKPDTFEIEI